VVLDITLLTGKEEVEGEGKEEGGRKKGVRRGRRRM
jgi:hypothetical protein